LAVCLAIAAIAWFGGEATRFVGLAAVEQTRQVLSYVLGIALVFSAARVVQEVMQVVVLEGLLARALGSPVPGVLNQLSAVLVYLVAVGVVVGLIFERDLTALWAASGVATVIVGMALRELIQDLFAGLALNIDRPIRIGDDVLIHRVGERPVSGEVLEINWRSTRLKDIEGNLLVVPNNLITTSTITNYSRPEPWYQLRIDIVLDVEVPPDRAMRLLEAGAMEAWGGFATPNVPKPFVRIGGVTAVGVEYRVSAVTTFRTASRVRTTTIAAILRHLDMTGLRPAVPREGAAIERPVPPSGTPQQVAAMLGRTALFAGAHAPALDAMAASATVRRLPAQSPLAQAGEAAASAFVILEGLARATRPRRTGKDTGTAGAGVSLGPGSLVGGGALLVGGTHQVTVTAATEVLIAGFDLSTLRPALEAQPDLAGALSRRVAEEHRASLAAGGAGTGAASTGAASTGAASTEDDDLADDVMSHMKRSFPDLALV
jgi:small-conductance mechanosensitive channel/CRP-like cAMP-binding protein